MKIIHDRDKSVTKQRYTCADHEEKERIKILIKMQSKVIHQKYKKRY
jgi:hypothetical protein